MRRVALLLAGVVVAAAPLLPGTGAVAATTTITTRTTITTTGCVPSNGAVQEIGPTWIRFRIPSSSCVPQAIFYVDLYQPAPDGSWTRVGGGSAQRDPSGGGSILVSELTPATAYWYAFHDPRGVSAPRTGPVTTLPLPTTTTTTAPACTATFFVREQWDGAFRGEVQVTPGAAGVSGWTVSWSLAPGQGVAQSWNADVATSGTTVTARSVSWNGALAPGQSAVFGFIGSWSGSNPVPAVHCTAG